MKVRNTMFTAEAIRRSDTTDRFAATGRTATEAFNNMLALARERKVLGMQILSVTEEYEDCYTADMTIDNIGYQVVIDC